MRNRILQILLVLTIFASQAFAQKYQEMIDKGSYSVFEIQKEAEKYFETKGKGKGTGHKQFKRWEYNALREMDENGYLPDPNAYYQEHQRFQRAYRETHRNQRAENINTGNWAELGPTYWRQTSGWNPGVGRITSFAIDKGNTDHIIVGANTGGVWRTTNKGQNWAPLGDDFTTMEVVGLAMDPQNTNIYYWGSNYGNVYKSTDAGANWVAVGKAGSSNVNKILVHPTNSNILFATSEYSGIYKSTNAGTSWTKVSSSSRGYDIQFKPNDPNTVYVSGTGFYKSTDGGNNFTQITTGTGVQMIGVSAADANKVYVLEASGGKFGNFYSSTNSGSSFTKLDHTGKNYFGYSTTASDDRGQAPRDMAIAVNPTNANEVHIAGILTWKSTNAGTSFSCTSDWVPQNAASKNIGYCHADVDIMQFIGTKLYVGSDGGLFIAEQTANVSSNYYTDLTAGLGIRQFYKIGVSRDTETDVVVSGGSQDNGTSVMKGADAGWYDWLGADGMETFVDWSNPNNLFGTSQFGSLYKSSNGGQSYSGVSKPAGSGNWVTPLEQDPQVATTVYTGYTKVYKSTNFGGSWTEISQDFGGNLSHLKIASSNNNIMYASRGSSLYKTTTGSGTWSLLTTSLGNINYISIHPTDPNKIALATNSSNRVYVSTNGGTTWTSYLKNLPNMTAYCVLWDAEKDGLYVGMNYGIYYINSDLTTWEPFMTGIPNVKVNELEIANGKLYAATYGRGLWASDVYSTGPSLTHDVNVVSVANVSTQVCGTDISPIVTIENLGTETLTTVTLKVYANNVLIKTVNHTTSLTKGQTQEVTISTTLSAGANTVKVVAENPNGQADQNTSNDEESFTTEITNGVVYEFYISERSMNNNLSWTLLDEQQQIVQTGNATTAIVTGNLAIQEMCLAPTCYELQVSDPFATSSCTTPAWVSGTEYCGGSQVSHNGFIYTADWCTTSEPGSGQWIGWQETGLCSGASYDNDVLGIKVQGHSTSEVEVTVANFSTPYSATFGTCSQIVAPTVSLLTPIENAILGDQIGYSFTVNANDADGTVEHVAYAFSGPNGFTATGGSAIAPFNITYGFTEIGIHQVIVTATDNEGNTTSTTSSFNVVDGTPSIALTSHVDNEEIITGQATTFTVDVSDVDGTITKVKYVISTGGPATTYDITTAPYSLEYTPTNDGGFYLQAIVFDNNNRTNQTIGYNIIAVTPVVAPTISILTPNASSIIANSIGFDFTVDANDADGTVTQVIYEFTGTNYSETTTSTTAPFTVEWGFVNTGTYQVKAIATDNDGNTTSATKSFEVIDGTPTITILTPANNATLFKDQSNLFTVDVNDVDGTIATVDYYFRDGGAPTVYHAENAPYSLDYIPTFTGTIDVDVIVIDNDNRARTASITINIVENQAPTVAITSPTTGSSFAEGIVTFTVNAQDTDGTISKVELYSSPNTLLATSTTVPYSFDLELTEGNYGIFAKAYDNFNASSASSIVGVEITANVNTCTLPEWSSTATYNGGNEVQYQGISYKANWWTNVNPATNNGVTGTGQPWTITSTCTQRAGVQQSIDFVAVPNPFTTSVNLSFSVEETSYVELSIYNLQGEKVATLVNETLEKGNYSDVWNTELTGSYVVKLVVGNELSTQVIIKQ